MIDKDDTRFTAIGARLLDDSYLAWFSAESECEQALRDWFQRTGVQRTTAYFAYRAALDREEAAARDLERVWRFAGPRRGAVVHRNQSVVE